MRFVMHCFFSFSFSSINNRGHLTSSLEEYLDHIHYLQDIFLLNVDSLNNVLKDQLMNRLLIPVYVFSLIKRDKFSRVTVSASNERVDCRSLDLDDVFQHCSGSSNNTRPIFCFISPCRSKRLVERGDRNWVFYFSFSLCSGLPCHPLSTRDRRISGYYSLRRRRDCRSCPTSLWWTSTRHSCISPSFCYADHFQTSYSSPPTALDVCLAKVDSSNSNKANSGSVVRCFSTIYHCSLKFLWMRWKISSRHWHCHRIAKQHLPDRLLRHQRILAWLRPMPSPRVSTFRTGRMTKKVAEVKIPSNSMLINYQKGSLNREDSSQHFARSIGSLDRTSKHWFDLWIVRKVINGVSMLWVSFSPWQQIQVGIDRTNVSFAEQRLSLLAVDSVILESVCLTVKSSVREPVNRIRHPITRIFFLSTRIKASTIPSWWINSVTFFVYPPFQVSDHHRSFVWSTFCLLPDSNIRLVTLSLTITLLKKLVYNEEERISYLSDHHLARIEQVHEQSAEDLRRHYRVSVW